MTSDVEYLLLKDKGPFHEVCVRRRLNANPGLCKFYTIASCTIAISLLVLLASLVYVFVLVPSWQGRVLTWDGRTVHEAKAHVVAHTGCGPVEGAREGGVFVFKGIPYALPPVGNRRWRKPEGLSRVTGTCWSGTKRAQQFGPVCVQPGAVHNMTVLTGSEDCLYLNVWSPSLDPLARRPVMLWLHAGNLVHGSGHAPPLSPTPEVSKATGAVYVSINYRLGPFGFLALDMRSKDPSAAISGNFGLMDVILALTWVRDNIHNFGGDINKVTVFGQGSGGTLIHALLASPLASGLFHRAWLASPSAVLNTTLAQASRDNHVFLSRTDCRDVECLRGLDVARVMDSTPWTESPYWGMQHKFDMPAMNHFTLALPVIDGYVLREAPLKAWMSGRGNDVPTMFTTTAQETDLLPFDPTISSWSWDHYAASIKEQLSSFSPHLAQRALQLYPAASPISRSQYSRLRFQDLQPPMSQLKAEHQLTPENQHTQEHQHKPEHKLTAEHQQRNVQITPEYQYTSLVSDIRATCPVSVLANVTSRKFQSPVYRGVVTSCPSRPINLLNVSAARYAFHGWDLVAFFGNFGAISFTPSARDLKFQNVLRQQMVTFAMNGRPEAPVWDTAQTCTALLSDHVFPVERFNGIKCNFWIQNGFFSYAWIN